jgi:NitT/TauT family transport system substrate-binding protein
MERRTFLIGSGAAALTVGLARSAFAQANAKPEKSKVKLGVGGKPLLYYLPLTVAERKGYFKDEGIEVELKNIGPSGDRMAALIAGSVAFSNLGRIAAIVEMARNNQSFYFFANIDDSPGNEGCWARPGFASFKDLRGKKVAANTSAPSNSREAGVDEFRAMLAAGLDG